MLKICCLLAPSAQPVRLDLAPWIRLLRSDEDISEASVLMHMRMRSVRIWCNLCLPASCMSCRTSSHASSSMPQRASCVHQHEMLSSGTSMSLVKCSNAGLRMVRMKI